MYERNTYRILSPSKKKCAISSLILLSFAKKKTQRAANMSKTAVIAGATGLVGKELLDHLIEEDYYEKIQIISRRVLSYDNPKVEVVVVDYNHLNNYREKISGSHYYCCLGTTMKAAGSRYNFYRIDYVYVYRLAKIAESDSKCSQFVLLTSVGANAQSSVFYNRVKGRAEKEVGKLKISGIHILRPSILLGNRKKRRLYEELAKLFSAIIGFFLIGDHTKFIAIEVPRVAKAMFYTSKSETTGIHIYSPYKINQISKKKST